MGKNKQEIEIKKLKEEKKELRHQLHSHSKKYVIETRKALATAILAAFGFLMALSWREVISEWAKTITQISFIQGRLIEAIIVTLISVLGILLVTRFIAIKD